MALNSKSLLKLLLSLAVSLIILLLLSLWYRTALIGNDFPSQEPNEQFYSQSLYQQRLLTIQKEKEWQLSKPLFYFSIRPRALKDSIYSITPLVEQKALVKILSEGGNEKLLLSTRTKVVSALPELSPKAARFALELLQAQNSSQWLQAYQFLKEDGSISLPDIAAQELIARRHWSDALPSFSWHGADNQFQNYLSSMIMGRWGRSKVDGQLISRKIQDALPHTLLISLSSLFLSLLLGVCMGTIWALYPKHRLVMLLKSLAYFLTVIPVFWIASLMISLLTPAYGIPLFELPSPMAFEEFSLHPYLFPVCTIVLASWGYIARQFEDQLSQELKSAYVQIAQTRSVRRSKWLLKYCFPNAMIPLIGLLGGSLGILVSGSLVIEILFNIPGMGRLLLESIRFDDYSLITYLLLLMGIVTLLGRWLSDRLMEWLNPKINFNA